jgi:hypothetical protein
VKVKFKSDAFPLERFADSAAIQLINQNAKVPVPQPAQNAAGQPVPATPAAAPAASTSPNITAAPAAPAASPPPKVPPPAAQSLAEYDPWSPRF